MKTKIKEMVACMLIGLLFAGMFWIGISISSGEMTRLEGSAIMVVSSILVFGYAFGIKEEQ